MQRFLSNYKNEYQCLILAISFCFSLILIRIKLTHSLFYAFLVWNLFLAAIPYFITQTLQYYSGRTISKWVLTLLFLIWLLFLPNSPYIITDLIHLQNKNSTLLWFDLFLIFVFAMNGLLLGLLSMIDMYGIVQKRFSKKLAGPLILMICALCGYGVYLGRFLRFNSWDILIKPQSLFVQIAHSFQKPMVWAMTLAFGGFLLILFLLLQSVLKRKQA